MPNLDFLENERDEARYRLAWHLQRCASWVLMEVDLGELFEIEMRKAEAARKQWREAHDRLHEARFSDGG